MKSISIIATIAWLSLTLACGRPTGFQVLSSPDPQKLPFDRQPQTSGISPSHSFIPFVNHLPEGTPLTVSLQRSLSSASAHVKDSFTATLDDPIVIDAQTVVPSGAPVTGRVIEAKSATRIGDAGYLRISLDTIAIAGKQVPIATTSFFSKAGSHEDRSSPIPEGSILAALPAPRETVLAPGRRFSFRLTQQVDLP